MSDLLWHATAPCSAHVAVTGRKRLLLWNAMIEINTVKSINIYQSLAAIVQQL